MSIILIVGELGETNRVDSISEYLKFKNRLKRYIDSYSRKINLDQNEICLFDKNGRSFNLYDIQSNESKFFIFHKVFYKEQLVKIFEENLNKYVSNYNLPNVLNVEISPLKILINELPLLEKFNLTEGEIRQIDENMISSFDTCKSFYRSIKQTTKMCERIKENYTFQFNSLECLYRNISNLYEQVLNKYKDTENSLFRMIEKNEKCVAQFKESIDKLKKTEIHPKMQTNGVKYLIDIYFDEVKMNEWKEKCMKTQDILNKKIKSQASVIHDEKNKIRAEKNLNMNNLKNE